MCLSHAGRGAVMTREAAPEFQDVVKAILYGHIVSGLPEQVTYEGFGFFLHGSE